MASTTDKLTKRGLHRPPSYLSSNVMYETVVGSVAYGVSDEFSDYDITGFFMSPISTLFPHLNGYIHGFDKEIKAPKAYQKHRIIDPDKKRQYDLNIYPISIYFKLCLENNPNMVTTLYTPRQCVLHSSPIAELVRENRDKFLHKQCWSKYKGYAFSQLHKMRGKNPEEGSKRWELRQKYGFDVKHGYHLVRLLLECEMILQEGTMDISRHKEHLKAIRHGELKEKDIIDWAANKEKYLEKLYHNTKLRPEPDHKGIKSLLLKCLEQHYGNITALEIVRKELQPARIALRKIKEIFDTELVELA